MTENYLDISKSVMISAPAGSGKTEKLARRYIELLKNGSDVERILAITFTEKAAAEMKERILNILKKEDLELFEKVREKMPRMRISTIHSFCLKLLKRFSLDLDIDPSLEVMDSFNAGILWSEAIYETLIEDGMSGEQKFYDAMKESGIKGWDKLYKLLNELHAKRPAVEMAFHPRKSQDFLGAQALSSHEAEAGRYKDQGDEYFKNVLSIYSKCLDRYKEKKLKKRFLDYNDLEILAYEAISRNAEWHNVLYSFDEHTDHLLVDEFQDTSTLQWKIIDKLTEEWRSGLGAKRESGIKPTIFLVGDDKQSIYSFRGANVSIFKNAGKKLTEWLRDEYHFIEIKENYRSLPAIVNFVNALFECLMPAGLYDEYRVEYKPFEAARTGEGAVELLLLDSIGNTKANRKAEAAAIAGKIQRLLSYEIYGSDSKKRFCSYGDMAILLRNRTHLPVFEDALRKEGVPFVVVKGIGFYNSPEVCLLRDIVFFLIDPMDDYSLFNILRSPLFSIGYDSLVKIVDGRIVNEQPAGYLYSLLKNSDDLLFASCCSLLNSWIKRSKDTLYSVMLEEILAETGAWEYFHEEQRHANMKKFIRLVEEFESRGLTGLEIREKLIKASDKSGEPKANVNTAGMDAVKIMTVHGSKGLQFPVVFLPCMDEENRLKNQDRVVINEDENGAIIAYGDNAEERKTLPVFQMHKEKVLDEEKRLFYVAATRAMDYLCMSGIWQDSKAKYPSGKLAYIADSFNLIDIDSTSGLPFKINKVTSSQLPVDGNQLPIISSQLPVTSYQSNEPIFIEPLDYKPAKEWSDVTEEIQYIRKRHGDDWVVLGRAFHKVFEGMSKGYITMNNLSERITGIIKNEMLSDSKLDRMKDIILSDIRRLDDAGYLKEIVLPRDDSYAELPFVFETGSKIYKGRVDRVIIRTEDRGQKTEDRGEESGDFGELSRAVRTQGDKIACIYDYKTYPVREDEIPYLLKNYSFQMKIYREAVERIFSFKKIRVYLFFTHKPAIIMLN
jgi:ATP-dependent helicase/nuclease subunit A